MPRLTGYLANILNVPPLIFRFQYNPEILSEKKAFKYRPVNSFGDWGFNQASAASGVISTLTGAWKDIKNMGALLVATKPLEPEEGDQRQFSIDFVLDALNPGPMDNGSHFGGSIEPDLAILRSFMNPSLDLIDLGKLLFSGLKDWPCWNRPPECTLVYAGLNVTCVMTDLNIKITAFQDDRTPQRAEVNVTLKEQTFSVSPITEFLTRNVDVIRSFDRANIGRDIVAVTPGLNLFESKIFE